MSRTIEHLRAVRLDVSPGNGTRYRLVVAVDRSGNLESIAWPDIRWSVGDLGRFVTAEWLQYNSDEKLSRADGEAIVAIIESRPWEREDDPLEQAERAVRAWMLYAEAAAEGLPRERLDVLLGEAIEQSKGVDCLPRKIGRSPSARAAR